MKSFVAILLSASAFAAKTKQLGTDINGYYYGDITDFVDADTYYETYEYSTEDSYSYVDYYDNIDYYDTGDFVDADVVYDSYYADSYYYDDQILGGDYYYYDDQIYGGDYDHLDFEDGYNYNYKKEYDSYEEEVYRTESEPKVVSSTETEKLDSEVASEQTYVYYDHEKTEENDIAFDTYIEEQTASYEAWLETSIESTGITLESMMRSMHEEMWAAAALQWGQMPEVCDDGKPCRDEIWISVETAVQAHYRETYSRVTSDLESMMRASAVIFEKAWREAKECPHGCYVQCTEKTIIYTNTVNRITDIEHQIEYLMREHETEVETYESIVHDCPDDVERIPIEHYNAELY